MVHQHTDTRCHIKPAYIMSEMYDSKKFECRANARIVWREGSKQVSMTWRGRDRRAGERGRSGTGMCMWMCDFRLDVTVVKVRAA